VLNKLALDSIVKAHPGNLFFSTSKQNPNPNELYILFSPCQKGLHEVSSVGQTTIVTNLES
jgi:hypothetical protein